MLAYDTDLAFVHDAGFLGLAESGAELALELLAECPDGPVLELGSGSGATAARLLAAGREVIGWDVSAGMIELARRKAPAAEFRLRSYVDSAPPEGLAMVLAIGEIFNYAFDERSGFEALGDFTGRAHQALQPGGVLLFDSAGPGRAGSEGATQTIREGEDWAILCATAETTDPPGLTREITTFRRRDGEWRRRRETHRLHLYPPAAVREALEGAGFEVEVRPSYGGEEYPALDVFLARRS